MGEERKLDLDERPLVVQLNWTTGNREGRFVLKKDKESSEVILQAHSLVTQSQSCIHVLFCVLNNKGKLSEAGKRRRDPNLQENAVKKREEEGEAQN